MSKNELVEILDKFIEEKNASWNHEDWVSLLAKVKEKGINLPDSELGVILEGERDIFYAKKSGNYVFSRQKLIDSCKEFVKRTNAEFIDAQKIAFMNDLSVIGTYNKYELSIFLESEKKKYLESKKHIRIELAELNDLRAGITELQRKLLTKDNSITELNTMIEKLQSELIKNETSFRNHIEESEDKDKLLEILKNDMKLERNFVDNTTQAILEKEQSLNAKEAELKAKGFEVSEKLAELSKKLEYYKSIEKKYATDSENLQKVTVDFGHQKSINNMLTKKVSLLESQLHSKIGELEKIKVVYKEMQESYDREKTLLTDAEKRLREFGRDSMENRIVAEKKQGWILEHEKPLIKLENKLASEKKELNEKKLILSKKEYDLQELNNELSVREKAILQKETKLVLLYKELDKKKSEIALAKKEVDSRYIETGRSLKDKQAQIDMAINEFKENSQTIAKERLSLEKIRAELLEKESHLRIFYKELQNLKIRLDKREIEISDKGRKLEVSTQRNKKLSEDNQVLLDKYKNSLVRFKTELMHKEKEIIEKSKKVQSDKLYTEGEKLKLEKKFLSMITNKD